jgi:hypothetical protein
MLFRTAGILFVAPLTLGADSPSGPKSATVLIIRHAEKPTTGATLSPAGEQRAQAYVRYFHDFAVDGTRLTLDVIVAAKDSKASVRPRLTVEPFANAAGLRIDKRFRSTEPAQLVAAQHAMDAGKSILICWRHGDIPGLLQAFGVEPKTVLPHGKWPDPVFDWVIMLQFDQDGHFIPGSARRINEQLMPGDSN